MCRSTLGISTDVKHHTRGSALTKILTFLENHIKYDFRIIIMFYVTEYTRKNRLLDDADIEMSILQMQLSPGFTDTP